MNQKKIGLSINSSSAIPLDGFRLSRNASNKKYQYHFFKADSLASEQSQSNSPRRVPLSGRTQKQQGNLLQQGLFRRTDERVIEEEEAKVYEQQNRIKNFRSAKNLQLDPRDEKVPIKFKSLYYQSLFDVNSDDSLEPLQDELRDWLVDVIEITTSIGYNHLNKGTLTQKQTKNFISKNILQNIKQVFEQYKQIPLQLRYRLMKFINEQSHKIFDHIGRKYPQSRSKGVSKRIKSRIPVINNRSSNDFDFLLYNDIKIRYRDDGDYSEDIMRIVNKLITFSNEVYDKDMEVEDSNYEVFTDIMEYIFQNSVYQTPEGVANEVARIIGRKKKKIDDNLEMLNQNNQIDIDDGNRSLDTRQFARIKEFQKSVQIGQKIPIGVPLFSQEDIYASKFKIYDSSILRLLTKWSQQLRNMILNAQQTIYRRRFKFKNNKGKRLNLEPQMKKHLYKAAIDEMETIEKQLKYLKDENFLMQTFFAQEQNTGKYAKHDTKVGVFVTKLNEIASQYIFKYLNKLIHALLSIPNKAAKNASTDREKTIIQSINLVTFKIGDMMRCKCSCSEQQFLRILKSIESIHHLWPDILKMSRIKNRLQTQNNDILINFFFGNKAQCELQLSVLSSDKNDEKNSSKMSHLIYQIVRAELGPISQMANIVVQCDPLVYYYSKLEDYGPDLIFKKCNSLTQSKFKTSLEERLSFRQKVQLGANIQLPFICCSCQKLAIVHNPQFYYRDLSKMKRTCNDCLTNSFSYSNKKYMKLRQHVLDQNFEENQTMRTFFKNHVTLWNTEEFINNLKNQTIEQVNAKLFPSRGYAIKYNQKKPKLELFACIFEQTYSHVIFANKTQKGQNNILFKIKIHEEKEKKIKNIIRKLKRFAIFYIVDVIDSSDQGIRYFACNKPNCCGLKINPGPSLSVDQVQDYINEKMIKKPIQTQSKLLYLNYMQKGLDKLEKYLNKIKQKNQIWKIRNTVQAVQAFQCKVSSIRVVGLFAKLSDLNIGDNPDIKSLEGIQHCSILKYLNCSGCDLQHIDGLRSLKKLETLNVTNNGRLESIQSLENHSELQDLFLRNTPVRSLTPLQNCLKLQSLDLQGCKYIKSISQVKSDQLSYISIINCLGIDTFDLPSQAVKSLKTVELTKNEVNNAVSSFVSDVSLNLSQKRLSRQDSQGEITDEAIDKINKLLKIRKAQSTSSLGFNF